MKSAKILTILVLALGLTFFWPEVGQASPMGTVFTYQGNLYDANYAANGLYDFAFKLYDADSDGNNVGADVNVTNVDVIDGYFTIELDFNDVNAFNGEARWLEIDVRPGDSNDPCDFVTLSPRMQITAAPYALALPAIRIEQNEVSPNIIGGWKGNYIAPGVVGSVICGGGSAAEEPNEPGSNDIEDGDYSCISGGDKNIIYDDYCFIGGGYNNQAGVDDGYDTYQAYATIAGGKNNNVTDHYGTIGGGKDNTVDGAYGTIGGGGGNTCTGATIAGGSNNEAVNLSAIGGGMENEATGLAATVPGGAFNVAQGDYSFAAGYRAKANHGGTFVWADSTSTDFASTGDDQFLIRAAGGVGIGTTSPVRPLHIRHSIDALARFESTDAWAGIELEDNGGTVSIYSRLGEFVIDANDKDVGINETNPSYPLHMGNGAYCSAGGVWTDAPSFYSTKENISELEIAGFVEKLKKLKLFRYQKKAETQHKADAPYHNGYILDDASTPEELLSKDPDGNISGLSAQQGVAFLLAVCKEQQATIDEVKADNEFLKERIATLEKAIQNQPFTVAREVQQ